MDPDEAYQRVWSNVQAILNDEEADLIELAEAFEALDEWLQKDGYLPAPWRNEEDEAALKP